MVVTCTLQNTINILIVKLKSFKCRDDPHKSKGTRLEKDKKQEGMMFAKV